MRRPRRVVRIEGSVEAEIPFPVLSAGMGFKVYESDGKALNYGDIFVADSDPYIDNGVWAIKAIPLIFGERAGGIMTVSSFS